MTERFINNLIEEESGNRTVGNDRIVGGVRIYGLIQRECDIVRVKSAVRAAIPDSDGCLGEACHQFLNITKA